MIVLRVFIALFLAILVTLVAPAYAQNQTQTQTQTPQIQPSFELSNNVSTLMRSLLTEEVSGVDRSLLISDLERAIQSFLTDTVNVEFDTRDDGNEKVLTITTTSAPTEPGSTEEQPVEEDTSNDNGNDNGNGNGNDGEPEEPEPPTDIPALPIG
jgi:UTP:GlnB (protein PII) uridylyltransferase